MSERLKFIATHVAIGVTFAAFTILNTLYYPVSDSLAIMKIDSKGKREGVAVIEVDPRNTSRTCTECGYCDKKNRKSQSEFVCLKCGHAENADTVGAKNIALRASVTKPIVASVDAKADTVKAEPELRRRTVTSPIALALGS